MMKRREALVTLLGSAAAAFPLAAKAQQSDQRRRIGVLTALTEDDPENQARLAAFRYGLERRGWSEGRNLRIDYRFAPGASPDQSQPFAKELVALRPDAILAQTTPVVTALQRETREIPIVFAGVADPIGSGFIASLPHPGSNITGVMLYEPSVTGKWLSMLKEIAPQLTRAAFVIHPETATYYNYYLQAAEPLSRSLGIDLVPTPFANTVEIERAIEVFASVPNGGLVLPPNAAVFARRDLIVALAARHHLPAVYNSRPFVTAGGLMSYGVDVTDMFRQAASYVDRILRGDNPADLPVQAATRFETILNLKTAKALGLTVPPGLLVAADEVIE
jgi:putative ABC transport system substrate-binding protein